MNKKKVVYVCGWYNPLYNDLFNNLDKDIEVTMILSEKFPNYKLNNYEVKVFSGPDIGDYIYFYLKEREVYLLSYKKDFENYIKKLSPDIIIANLVYMPSTYQAYKISKKYNIKFVLQTEMKILPKGMNGFLFRIYDFFFSKNVVFGADKVISWCSDSKNFFIKRYKILKEKTDYVLPGIDLDKFKPLENKKSNDKIQILMIARFTPYKNHKTLLNAAKKLINMGFTNFEINLLGKGPYYNYFKKYVIDLNLENYVNFEGFIPHDEMPNYIAKNDFLVLPSYNEAIGLCVIEAMACGLPAIVSDTCGGKDYVINNKTGFIFKTGDVDDLAEKILKLSKPDLLFNFSKASRKRALKFDQRILSKKFSKIIKNL